MSTDGRAYRTPEEAFEARTERRGECLIWVGAGNGVGYGRIWVGGTSIYAHRFAWERENGPIPPKTRVDHREHCDTRCVEVSHLRLATVAQNGQNRGPGSGGSKTGKRNVYPNGKGFSVKLKKDGEVLRYGTYPTLEEAVQVAEKARAEQFGEFAGRG